jgi:hypothetical protein
MQIYDLLKSSIKQIKHDWLAIIHVPDIRQLRCEGFSAESAEKFPLLWMVLVDVQDEFLLG